MSPSSSSLNFLNNQQRTYSPPTAQPRNFYLGSGNLKEQMPNDLLNMGPRGRRPVGCSFCRTNKESYAFYSSHQLKDKQGGITCPNLSRHVCELCGATGRDAHTRSYCHEAKKMRLEHEAIARERRKLSESSSSASTICGDPSSSSSSPPPQQPPPARSPTIRLANSRMCHNIGAVTSSRYNSAGEERFRSRTNNRHNKPQNYQTYSNPFAF